MKTNIKFILGLFSLSALLVTSCQEETYSLGDLTAPSNIVISAQVVGANTANPNGDGSGDVTISVTADNALNYKVGYNDVTDLTSPMTLTVLPTAGTTKKFTTLGLHTYRITVVAYGKGGTSTTATKEVTLISNFNPDPAIVTNITNNASKTWVVDKSVPGHFGVGPWSTTSSGPDWWAAAINEKVLCCNCFYTTTFTFTKSGANFSLQVTNPDGAFTKTGSLSTIPGIPASGAEGCYNYGGGTAAFSFVPTSSGLPTSVTSTQTSILLGGTTTYIGYGSLQKEYEIMVSTPTYMYLRVQGTETGNAWYIKLKPTP